MATFCLLPNKIEEFKKALKEKDISLDDIVNMESDERVKLLEKYAGDSAKGVSDAIEQKLILKNRVMGLENLLGKLTESGKYDPIKKAETDKIIADYKEAQRERIFNPKENESYLKGLSGKILGVEISREAANKVFEMTSELHSMKGKDAKISGVSDEYLKKRSDLNAFVKSFEYLTAGQSIGRNAAIFGRNSLIFNLSVPIKAGAAQILNSAIENTTRRLSGWSLTGGNTKIKNQASREAWDTYKKTGFNTAGMESMDDRHALGKGEEFQLPNQKTNRPVGILENTVRNIAKVSNIAIIDWAHQVPFTHFYQKTFFDAVDFTSSDIAKAEGLKGDDAKKRAEEVFKDAARIEPETPEGKMVRMNSQKQAAWITSTNDTWASKVALAAKQGLNKVNPNLPLGNLIVPIAKIPATAFANAIDSVGFGSYKGIKDIYQGKKKIQSDNLQTKYEGMIQLKDGIQHMIRILGVTTAGLMIANQLTKQDFKTDNYGAHFVKIGNTWINTEYISAISPALAGHMAYKESGNIFDYPTATIQGARSLPGIDDAAKLRDAFANGKGIKYLQDFGTSRAIPAFAKNLSQDRPVNRLFFGAHGVETEEQVKDDEQALKAKADKTKAINKAKKQASKN